MEEKIKVPVPPKKFPPPPPNLSKVGSEKSISEEVKAPQSLSQNLPPKPDVVKESVDEKENIKIVANEKKEKKPKKEVDKVKLLSLTGIIGGGCLFLTFLVLLIVL